MLNIRKGKISRPQKVVIYGPEGVGKTSLAAAFPNPLFIDTEGGTAHLEVNRIDSPRSWEELVAIVGEVAATPNLCRTLVIDTSDWAEQLAINHICSRFKKGGIEEFGYSKGYVYLAEEFSRLFAALDRVVAAGIHVVITAHAKMRKFEQPDEMGSYDRWETKLTKQVAPLLKEWCDLLLFCNYQTFVVQSGNAMEKSKVQGGKRVMYTSHHPCWDAKNRHGLPEVLDLDFKHIAHLFGDVPAPAPAAKGETPLDTLRTQMQRDGVTEADLQQVVAQKGHYPVDTPIDSYPDRFITGWLLKYWPQILTLIPNHTNATKEDVSHG